MAKATVMRLAGTPSLPAVAPVPRQHRAHNHRGAAVFVESAFSFMKFQTSSVSVFCVKFLTGGETTISTEGNFDPEIPVNPAVLDLLAVNHFI